MNGTVYFSHEIAQSFYTKIKNMAFEVYETMHTHVNKPLLNTVLENTIFETLIYSTEEDDYNETGELQNIDMFLTKFRGILFDFKRELYWSFKCNFIFLLN